MPELSTRCPYCFSKMAVKKLVCQTCSTEVKSDFDSPKFLELSPDQQKFAIDFILASGSLKEMANILNVSYTNLNNSMRCHTKLGRQIGLIPDSKQPSAKRRWLLNAIHRNRRRSDWTNSDFANSARGSPAGSTLANRPAGKLW